MEAFLITENGFKKLQKEIDHLKDNERPKIIKQIADARDLGDLKENAEYHSAKEKQGIIEAKISDLTNKLSRAKVINELNLSTEKVMFGVNVELEDLDTQNIVTYKIVSEYESDIDLGHISDKSPIARALIGKTNNEELEIRTPGGLKEYKINKIFTS